MEDLSDSSSSWIPSDDSWSSDEYEVLHEREKRKTDTLKRKRRIQTVPAKRANILRSHTINDVLQKPETDLREKIINSLLVIKCCFDDLFEAVGIQNYDFSEEKEKEKCVVNEVRENNKESGIGSSDDDNMCNGIREIQTENEFNMSTSSSLL